MRHWRSKMRVQHRTYCTTTSKRGHGIFASYAKSVGIHRKLPRPRLLPPEPCCDVGWAIHFTVLEQACITTITFRTSNSTCRISHQPHLSRLRIVFKASGRLYQCQPRGSTGVEQGSKEPISSNSSASELELGTFDLLPSVHVYRAPQGQC